MWKKILEKVFPMSRKGQQERFDQLFQQNEALQTMLAQQSSEILKRKNFQFFKKCILMKLRQKTFW